VEGVKIIEIPYLCKKSMNQQQPISLTDVVAFWGMITGTISLVVAYLNYKNR